MPYSSGPLISKLKNRISWTRYVAGIRAKRAFWDILSAPALPHILSESRIYTSVKNDPLDGDPILRAPGIHVQPPSSDSKVEYLHWIRRPLMIEPDFGYVIVKPFTLVDGSLPGSELLRSKRSIVNFSGLPSWKALREAYRKKRPVLREQTVVSLRFPFEHNYYHFFQDVLTRLSLLDEHGISRRFPLVVGSWLGKQDFFQRAIRRGALADRTWLVQEGFYIESDEVYISRAAAGNRQRLDGALDAMDAPRGDPARSRRVFLIREANRGRAIANWEELEPVVKAGGFEVTDPARLTLEQQMDLFRETQYLAGVHGAGLMNMVFRRNAPLRVFELFMPGDTPLMYYQIAQSYGFDYRYQVGRGNPENRYGAFVVSPDEFSDRLSELTA